MKNLNHQVTLLYYSAKRCGKAFPPHCTPGVTSSLEPYLSLSCLMTLMSTFVIFC